MITWCQKCGANPIAADGVVVDPPWCPDCCYVDYPRRVLLGPYESPEWFAPREFNTVDLKELRRERQRRGYLRWYYNGKMD